MAPRHSTPLLLALAGASLAFYYYKFAAPAASSPPAASSSPQSPVADSKQTATTTSKTTDPVKDSDAPPVPTRASPKDPPSSPAAAPAPSPAPLSDLTNSSGSSAPAAKKRYDPSRGLLNSNHQKVHFAAGCFWSVQLRFDRVAGVTMTRVGYTQGSAPNPTYDTVKTGKSGHAEAVEVTYDPSLVTLSELLAVFWDKHDAKSKNKQGNDRGTQYRSGVYYTDASQLPVILSSVAGEKRKLKKPWHKIHTEVKPAAAFYEAEVGHQKYLEKGGRHGKAQSAVKGCSDPIRCYG